MNEETTPAPRRRMLKGARLAFNHGHSAITCMLRDLSETGARVTTENTMSVPNHVTLVLDDGLTYDCDVVRRELRELGLRFR